MPAAASTAAAAPPPAKPGSLKDPAIAALFSNKDPDQRYDDLREIGHGSFGAVYYAFDSEKNETVAIKKMSFSGKQAVEKWNDIVKEVSFLHKIKHPNIVEYKACFLKEHTCWLVMEYCIGSTADIVDVLRTGLREKEIACVIGQTLAALVYLHSVGRIHRDIKAGNILLSDAGTVKLADFGSASLASPAQTFIGTPFFMAPEVILAMDEGHYTEKADIWSLGITCVELAERRPPLFNMNAMSALYHIAQNEPTTLAPVPAGQQDWSDEFKSFVEQCLRKDPDQRLSTKACYGHQFITRARPADTVLELMARTKCKVRELDNNQYKKMRKLVYLDEHNENAGDEETLSTGVPAHPVDALSVEGAGVGGGGADSVSSRSASIASLHSMNSGPVSQATSRGGSAITASSGGTRRRPPIPASMRSDQAELSRTVISVSASSSGAGDMPGDDSTQDMTSSSLAEGGASSSRLTSPLSGSFHLGGGGVGGERSRKDEMNTYGKSKFSTLRTTRQITREQEEYSRENNVAEQMSGYKRLRQQHHKELRQLEERCAAEAEALRVRLEKEMETLTAGYAKERTRAKAAHSAEQEKKRKEGEEGERKLRKQIAAKQAHEMKAFVACQLKEYKHNKELAKNSLKERGLTRSSLDAAIKEMKAQLQRQRQQAESSFDARQRSELAAEMNKYARATMLRQQALEERLADEELNMAERQTDSRQTALLRQHEQTRQLQLDHLREVVGMRKRHQEMQHEAELRNQCDYTQRLTDELRKRHAMQSRAQPRELKLKEAQIRKQYRAAVKTQTRQFKLWQQQLMGSAGGRDEQREVSTRLKEEQKRKIALLAAQYENQIESMVQEKTVHLESWQEEEASSLAERLAKELDELKAYQMRQRAQLDASCTKEKTALEDRIALRRAVLQKRFEEEREEAVRRRNEVRDELAARHRSEREAFEHSCGGGETTAL